MSKIESFLGLVLIVFCIVSAFRVVPASAKRPSADENGFNDHVVATTRPKQNSNDPVSEQVATESIDPPQGDLPSDIPYENYDLESYGIKFTYVDETVYAVVDSLNVRSDPDVRSGNVSDILSRGEYLRRIGYHAEWSAVILPNGDLGFVVSDFVSTEDPIAPQTPFTQISGSVCVTAEKLNVRSSPDTSSDNYVDVVSKGTILTVTGISEDGQWYRVLYQTGSSGDVVAFVMAAYVKPY